MFPKTERNALVLASSRDRDLRRMPSCQLRLSVPIPAKGKQPWYYHGVTWSRASPLLLRRELGSESTRYPPGREPYCLRLNLPSSGRFRRHSSTFPTRLGVSLPASTSPNARRIRGGNLTGRTSLVQAE
jgi:hypothetical protein